MQPFLHAHATHADWRVALARVLAQLATQREHSAAGEPTLGWCYLTDHHAPAAEELLAALRERYPGVDWVGAVGVGVCASGVEYYDEPGLAVMLAALPREQFRVFSGHRPLAGAREAGSPFTAHTALVHADPATPELSGLIAELSERVDSGYLFGGLASARNRTLTIAADAAEPGGVLEGGLSGVAFSEEVALLSRVTQGCQPVGPLRRITEAERNVVYALDGEPALDCLLDDLDVDENLPRDALPKLRSTLVGLSGEDHGAADEFDTPARAGSFGTETRVRHLIGLDPQRRGIAIADLAEPGQQLAFCRRAASTSRRDPQCARARGAAAGARGAGGAGRGAAHRRRAVRQLHRPRRPALRRSFGRAAAGAARARRRAAGRLLRGRGDRPRPALWLHWRSHGVHRASRNLRGRPGSHVPCAACCSRSDSACRSAPPPRRRRRRAASCSSACPTAAS